jgi:hypothetical protein
MPRNSMVLRFLIQWDISYQPVTGALGFKGEFSGIMERFYRTVQKNLPKIALFYCFSRHKSIIFADNGSIIDPVKFSKIQQSCQNKNF